MLLQILQTQRTLYKPTNGLSVDTGSKCLIHTVQVLQSVSENWFANLKHHSKLIFGVFCNFYFLLSLQVLFWTLYNVWLLLKLNMKCENDNQLWYILWYSGANSIKTDQLVIMRKIFICHSKNMSLYWSYGWTFLSNWNLDVVAVALTDWASEKIDKLR